MIYLLDTNILIHLLKNHPPEVAERIDGLPEVDEVCMSFFTWAELPASCAQRTGLTSEKP